jgi:hypothetical protein
MAIYDRRSPAQKKRLGLEVLAEFAGKQNTTINA